MGKVAEHGLSLKGFFRIAVYDTKKKKVVGFREVHNVVTDLGRQRIADLVRGVGNYITYAGAGTGVTAPLGSQTALIQELTSSSTARKVVTGTNATTIAGATIAAQF